MFMEACLSAKQRDGTPVPSTYLVGDGHHWQVVSARANGTWVRYDGPAFPLSNCADVVRLYLNKGVILQLVTAVVTKCSGAGCAATMLHACTSPHPSPSACMHCVR